LAVRRTRVISSDRSREGVDPGVIAEWVARAAEGDERAFRNLVEQYQDHVYGLALRMMRNPDLAADVAQDAFIKAFRGLSKFESRSRFATWLYRITVNVCYDRLARHPGIQEMPLEDLAGQGLEPAAGPAWNEDEDLELLQGAQAFEEALSELSDTYRLPFVLRQVEDLSYAEIAGVLEISETNAKVRVHRAREALVANLKKRGVL
jgi:RNA polymerase sigma factor (sigma-70 family)